MKMGGSPKLEKKKNADRNPFSYLTKGYDKTLPNFDLVFISYNIYIYSVRKKQNSAQC